MTRTDLQGGIFASIPGQPMRPAYSWGPAGNQQLMFQCPVSAIPDGIWTLLDLWWSCRQLRTLPLAGGLLDQPRIVRFAFTILEGEMRGVEARTSGGTAANAAALALGAVFGRGTT